MPGNFEQMDRPSKPEQKPQERPDPRRKLGELAIKGTTNGQPKK